VTEVETHALYTHGNGLGNPAETAGWERDRRRVCSDSFLGLTSWSSCSWLCKNTKQFYFYSYVMLSFEALKTPLV